MTYVARQNISVMLILSLLFSFWFTVAPVTRADAGILSGIGKVAKSLFVNVGSLAAGAMGAVVGMAVGGGPLGMAVGGLAGYYVGKKVLNWTTSSVANFATVAGAVGGGLLCAGMGFPMLAIGIVGGGLVSRLVTKGISKIFGKSKNVTISQSDIDEEAAKRDQDATQEYISSLIEQDQAFLNGGNANAPQNSQEAYELYSSAYAEYTAAVSRGDTASAQKALENYNTYYTQYKQLLRLGK